MHRYKRLWSRVMAALLAVWAGLWMAAGARAEGFADVPYTEVTKAQLELHNIMIGILTAIGVFVYVWMILALVKFRHRPGRQADQFEHSVPLEIAWTVVPTLILVVMAYPTYQVFKKMRAIAAKPDLTVEIVGHKWYWEYRYPDHGIQILDSDPVNNPKPMVVPVNKTVNVAITSVDVIHSWWVPVTGLKQDATPGHINVRSFNISRPGTYTGQCAELCGTLHGKMWITLEVKEPKYFEEWLKSQPKATLEPLPRYQPGVIPVPEASPSPAAVAAASPTAVSTEDLVKKGEQVYTKACVACHQVTGQGLPPAFPTLVGSEWVTGDKGKHITVILKGLSGAITVKGQSFSGVMPPGGNIGPGITDEEVAAVATYERLTWGNKAEPVTPEEVRAIRAMLK